MELQPSFSPDGTRVAFAWSMPPQKQPAIYVKLDGPGDPVKISQDLPRVFSPAWSPDGRWIAIPNWSRDGAWIYFTSWRTGRGEVWKMRANGGSETQVARMGGGLAFESADGRSLYFVRGGENSGVLWRMPASSGNATEVLSSVRGRLFTIFPKGFYFAAGSPQAELRYLEFSSGSVSRIAPLPGMSYADISPDEHWALFSRPAMSHTNLIMVETFR